MPQYSETQELPSFLDVSSDHAGSASGRSSLLDGQVFSVSSFDVTPIPQATPAPQLHGPATLFSNSLNATPDGDLAPFGDAPRETIISVAGACHVIVEETQTCVFLMTITAPNHDTAVVRVTKGSWTGIIKYSAADVRVAAMRAWYSGRPEQVGRK